MPEGWLIDLRSSNYRLNTARPREVDPGADETVQVVRLWWIFMRDR